MSQDFRRYAQRRGEGVAFLLAEASERASVAGGEHGGPSYAWHHKHASSVGGAVSVGNVIPGTGGVTDLVAYAKQVDAAVDAHWSDVLHNMCDGRAFCGGKVGPQTAGNDYVNALVNWIQDWRRYLNENVNITFPTVTQGNVDLWKNQLDEWIRKFHVSGGVSSTPALQDAPKDAGFPLTTILIVAGLFGAAFFLHEVRGVIPSGQASSSSGGAPRRLRK